MAYGFVEAVRFAFRGEKKWANLALGAVCLLIPIVGPIVFMGYAVLVERALARDMSAVAPDFDFGQFVEHLKRGVAPFVVGLLASLVMMVMFLPVGIPLVILIVIFQKEPWAMVSFIALSVVMEFVLMAAMMMVLVPLQLKAGLEQTIGDVVDWEFIKGFVKRAGLFILGMNLLLTLAFFSVGLPFMCVPFVGMYALVAVMSFVQIHLRMQAYHLYLERGGKALNIKEDAPKGAGFEPVMGGETPPR